jgi:hypothetical protein
MFSRKELADAYQCGVIKIRCMLHAIGVFHQGRITSDEFEMLMQKYGSPRKEIKGYTRRPMPVQSKLPVQMKFAQMNLWA